MSQDVRVTLSARLGPDARGRLGNAENTQVDSLMSCPIYRKYEFSDLVVGRSLPLLVVKTIKNLPYLKTSVFFFSFWQRRTHQIDE